MGSCRERPDLDRPVPNLIAVVLHQDVALLRVPNRATSLNLLSPTAAFSAGDPSS
jgi:hypothetical protein